MFETIVWATDGSELADSALPLVTELARTHGSKIVAVHANELLYGRFGCAPVFADEGDMQVKIERQVMDLRADGFIAEAKFEQGGQKAMADLIAAAAVEVDADLIVVGTHGRGVTASALLGSVTKGLLHVAQCPVLAVTPIRERVAVG
ncbi:MAG TPA: universal stress protein [Gaiellaceae bacterium]|nr:universal stress protein [Gaiellaceae bacterium]